MLASSINVSAHSHLSERLCDVDHAETSIAHDTSHDSQTSCLEQHPPSNNVDDYAADFDCNLCMHVCHDPVVTMCGHLFCWPCLFQWLSLHSASKECPVCKANVQDKIVPLYGCGKVGCLTDSLTENIPCRPSAIRPITCANTNRRIEPTSVHSGFRASLRRFGLASLPPQNGGFLSRYAHSAASLLVHRRRFNNEKEFVLHWVFISMASATVAAFFMAC